jgi:bile acid-coenzyme A ligase
MNVGRTDTADQLPSYGNRLRQLAALNPDGLALIFAAEDGCEREFSWRELDERSTQVARALAAAGLGRGDRLAIGLRNSPEHLFAAFGGWKLGSVVVPLRWDLPEWELARVQQVLQPTVNLHIGDLSLFERSLSCSTDPLPDVIPPKARGICSSGSTGSPKIIVVERPGVVNPATISNTSAMIESYGAMPHPQLVLVPGPLYHTVGFSATNHLLAGDSVVLLERFDAARVATLIERRRVNGMTGATVILQRIARLDDIGDRDFSSLLWVQQGAAYLPHWLARKWIDLVGPERFYMSYGMSEGLGLCVIRGDEWLEHPGSVGRPWGSTALRIMGPDGGRMAPDEVGEIYMSSPGGSDFSYLGDALPPARTEDGYATVGDLGWVDDDGFLYIADRQSDMIITGGANVYPAEVEAALSEHPLVGDVVVIGLRDPEWGRRIHALVVPTEDAVLTDGDVIGFAKSRLASYKVPKTVEFLVAIPRSEATKVNRSLLVEERESG